MISAEREALVVAALKAAIDRAYDEDNGKDAANSIRCIDPAAIAATVPEPRRPDDPAQAAKYDAFEWLRTVSLSDSPDSERAACMMFEVAHLNERIKDLERQRAEAKLREDSFQRHLNEALNSGDGSYRP